MRKLGRYLMDYLGLLLLGWACLFFVQRARRRRNKKGGKRNVGCYPRGAAAGNALQALHAILQPQAQYAFQEKLEEPSDEDDQADPKDPTAHLMRQAKVIQSGKEIERLTVLLPR
jgi:hypothetical protein